MARALASTPEPVYGTPASSKNPCTVPSSPYVPCMAMKTTSVPLSDFNLLIAFPVSKTTKLFLFCLSLPLRNFFSAGGKSHFPSLVIVTGIKLYLLLSSAAKITFAVARDTSCSAEGPPARTTTLSFLFIAINHSQRLSERTALSFGRIEANNLELVTESILSHWKLINFDEKSIILNPNNVFQDRNSMGFVYSY